MQCLECRLCCILYKSVPRGYLAGGRGLGSMYLGLTCLASKEPPVLEQEGGVCSLIWHLGPRWLPWWLGWGEHRAGWLESVARQLPFDGLYPGPGAPGHSQSPRAQADAYRKGLEPGREAAGQVTSVLKPDSLLCALLEGWRLSGQNAHSVNSAIATTLKWKGCCGRGR